MSIDRTLKGVIVLLIALIVALIWANSPLSHEYRDFIYFPIGFSFGHFKLQESLQFWVNEALMAFFFYVVSVEIKYEFFFGELSAKKKAILPVIAAIGGMVVPALIYYLYNPNGSASHGWGIPIATDIVFALGVLSLLGKRVPFTLKAFLLTLAIADDLGGIIVIAVFYAHKIYWGNLTLALIFAGLTPKVKNKWIFAFVAAVSWLCLLESGVHAFLTGVIFGFLAPMASLTQQREKTIALPLVVDFLILPLFALVNTGIVFPKIQFHEVIHNKVFLGVSLGLILGKPIGITAASWIAVKFKIGELPRGLDFKKIAAMGFIAGIGFTVATFIGHLALQHAPAQEFFAKLGILVASIIAAIAGGLLLALNS